MRRVRGWCEEGVPLSLGRMTETLVLSPELEAGTKNEPLLTIYCLSGCAVKLSSESADVDCSLCLPYGVTM